MKEGNEGRRGKEGINRERDGFMQPGNILRLIFLG